MPTIRSADGTPIALHKTGNGPPLLLVHGAGADHARWSPVLPAFNANFTVYAMDRRGRGASGDAATYDVEREAEDVAAAVDALGPAVNVLGHSYGGMTAVHGALLTRNIRRMVIYEPAVPRGLPPAPHPMADRLDALVAEGRRETAVEVFSTEVVGMTPHEVDLLKNSGSWPNRIAAIHTVPRELRAVMHAKAFDPARFAQLQTPVLMLLGGASPERLAASTRTVHAALPNSTLSVMPGQAHVAMNTATAMFVKLVLDFLA